jgi:hypothetical protein
LSPWPSANLFVAMVLAIVVAWALGFSATFARLDFQDVFAVVACTLGCALAVRAVFRGAPAYRAILPSAFFALGIAWTCCCLELHLAKTLEEPGSLGVFTTMMAAMAALALVLVVRRGVAGTAQVPAQFVSGEFTSSPGRGSGTLAAALTLCFLVLEAASCRGSESLPELSRRVDAAATVFLPLNPNFVPPYRPSEGFTPRQVDIPVGDLVVHHDCDVLGVCTVSISNAGAGPAPPSKDWPAQPDYESFHVLRLAGRVVMHRFCFMQTRRIQVIPCKGAFVVEEHGREWVPINHPSDALLATTSAPASWRALSSVGAAVVSLLWVGMFVRHRRRPRVAALAHCEALIVVAIMFSAAPLFGATLARCPRLVRGLSAWIPVAAFERVEL